MEEFHVWRTPARQLYTQGKIRRGGLERFGGSGRVIGPSLDLPGDGGRGGVGRAREERPIFSISSLFLTPLSLGCGPILCKLLRKRDSEVK